MYMRVKGVDVASISTIFVDFASISTLFDQILEYFRQCGIVWFVILLTYSLLVTCGR